MTAGSHATVHLQKKIGHFYYVLNVLSSADFPDQHSSLY
jgi:hypothetical protein